MLTSRSRCIKQHIDEFRLITSSQEEIAQQTFFQMNCSLNYQKNQLNPPLNPNPKTPTIATTYSTIVQIPPSGGKKNENGKRRGREGDTNEGSLEEVRPP